MKKFQGDCNKFRKMDFPGALDEALLSMGDDACVKSVTDKCIQKILGRFNDFYMNEGERIKVEILSKDSRSGNLVRFNGLIVDESQEDEYYLPIRLDPNGCWINVGLFKEPSEIEGAEEVPYTYLVVRRYVQVASIPGLSSWAKQSWIVPEGKEISEVKVILYGDSQNDQCRLGESLEFYGLLDSENCLHLIKALPTSNGLDYPANDLKSTRDYLLSFLSKSFGDDPEVARLFVAHLVSRIEERTTGLINSLLIGNLPLNFKVSEGNSSALHELVSLLCPLLVSFSINAAGLDSIQFPPSLDLETGTLKRGALQLTQGTQIILDETKLTACNLSEKATGNLKALMDLLDHQQVNIDFGFQTCQIPVDYPILSISNGKSILSFPWSVSVNSLSCDPTSIEKSMLNNWRSYLETCKASKVIIDPDLASSLEQDYVRLRQESPGKFDENHFASVLNLAKLLAKSDASQKLTFNHWSEALTLRKYLQ